MRKLYWCFKWLSSIFINITILSMIRFRIKSSDSGFIANSYDIASFLCLLPGDHWPVTTHTNTGFNLSLAMRHFFPCRCHHVVMSPPCRHSGKKLSILGPFLTHFWLIFDWFWPIFVPFWPIFGPFHFDLLSDIKFCLPTRISISAYPYHPT